MLLTSSWILDFIVLSAGTAFFLYKYSTRKFDYWKKRSVHNQQPIPMLGNFADIFFFRDTIGEWLRKMYDVIDEPYFGIFVYDEPHLIIKSPEIVKNILVKDFAHFVDRTVACPKHDKIHSNFLFMQKSPAWKTSRAKLTPVFTSGKLKGMFPIIGETSEEFVQYLKKNQGTVEAKEVCAKYSTEVIARCFFGIHAHCFQEEDAMFRKISRSIFDFRWRNAIIQTAYFFRQGLVDKFRLDFVEKWICDYFTEVIKNTMEAREKSNVRVNDFLDILRDMREKNELASDDMVNEKIMGRALNFFIAGFETTSSTISFTLHELCINPTIQNKLRKEIVANIKENKGITYNGVLNMKYLDMCVCETLRKYPVLPFLDRTCNKDYKVPGHDLIIEKGTPVYIPVLGIQLDENYFPEPQKYDPDRFLEKNYNTNGLVYFPFGDGPRNCIGERFGLMSSKLALVHILYNFEVEKCDKTIDPVQFEPKTVVLQSKFGLPMILKSIIPKPA